MAPPTPPASGSAQTSKSPFGAGWTERIHTIELGNSGARLRNGRALNTYSAVLSREFAASEEIKMICPFGSCLGRRISFGTSCWPAKADTPVPSLFMVYSARPEVTLLVAEG